MQENSNDYKFCIKLALDNAKKRINLLDNFDKKCVLEAVSYTHLTLPTMS